MRALAVARGSRGAAVSRLQSTSIPPAAWEASRPGSPRSTTKTLAPRLRNAMASDRPMMPPPTMITSQVFIDRHCTESWALSEGEALPGALITFVTPAAHGWLSLNASPPPIIRSKRHAEIHSDFGRYCGCGVAMGIRPMARPDRGLRSVVGAAAGDLVFLNCFKCSGLVCGVLCAGAFLQLSALHGDDLPRLPSRGRLSPLSDLHGSHHGVDRADADRFSCLGPGSALDFHPLPDVESVALQRAELRFVHDVCAARRGQAQ